MRSAILLGISAAVLAGAAGIGGPVSGYVLDRSSHSLVPINGLPGSAMIGTPLTLPFRAGMAAVSVPLDFALLAGARGGQVFLASGLISGQPAVVPLAGAMAVSAMALSGSGTGAVLYSEESHLLQFVSGLPASPVALAPTDVSQAGKIAVIAPDDSGSRALLVAADGTLYTISAGGGQGPQFVARIPGAAAAAVIPGGTDAVVGNPATGEILLVRDFAGSAAIATLAGAAAGITSVRDVAAPDAHHAAVIDASGRLAVIDLDTNVVTWVPLAGPADGFHPLNAGLLLLNQPGSGPLLLYAAAQGGSAFFVPAGNLSDSPRGTAPWTRH